MFEKSPINLIRLQFEELKYLIKPREPSKYKTMSHRNDYFKKLEVYTNWRNKKILLLIIPLTIIFCFRYNEFESMYRSFPQKPFSDYLLLSPYIFISKLNLDPAYKSLLMWQAWRIVESLMWVSREYLCEWRLPFMYPEYANFEMNKKFANEFRLLIINLSLLMSYIGVTLVYVLVGGAIPLFERKYLSLIQRRVGPKFVGYNGRLQVLADALKLLLKELITLRASSKYVLLILPITALSINIFICLNIVWGKTISLVVSSYTIFWILVIELVTTILVTHIGFLTKNKYTLLTSVRIINGTVVFELFLIAILSYCYVIYDTASFVGILKQPLYSTKLIYFWTIFGLLAHFILLLLKKVPFDVIEAETELIMGYASEHSGFLSGSLILIEYLHLLFWSYFLTLMFLY